MRPTNFTIVVQPYGQHEDAQTACWAPLEHQPGVACWRKAGHLGVHEDIQSPPCPACNGLDQHEKDCPQVDVTTNEIAYVNWRQTWNECGATRFFGGPCRLPKDHDGEHREDGLTLSGWSDEPRRKALSAVSQGDERG